MRNVMALMPSLNPRIVEALYAEALGLADAVRARFERLRQSTGAQTSIQDAEDLHRVQISCEALRTTTRMMHALAWLLNHRAFFAGELSEFQLRRHGRLPAAQPVSDPAQLALLDSHTVQVVLRSQAFYARVARIDRNWRGEGTVQPLPVQRLRAQIGKRFTAS